MAVTNIHPVTSTVNLCLNYIRRDKFQLNGDKMERHKTITSCLNCAEKNAPQMFEMQRQYYLDCGHANKKRLDGSENLAFHMVQSFDKKIDPELANEIGKRLAEEILSGYSCVISTHSNSDYTHNHFVFNAYKMDGSGKWHDCDETKDLIRKASDRLCKEYGLSVITENQEYKPIHYTDKAGRKRSYEPTARKEKLKETYTSSGQNSYSMAGKKITSAKKKDDSFTARIRADIDTALKSAMSYAELLQILNRQGYKINAKKKDGGWLKYVSFLSPVGERPIRDSTLGAGYTRESLSEKISELAVTRTAQSRSDNPLANYIRSDIAAKSASIVLLNKQKINSKTKEKIEYLKNCIDANLSALNTLNKYSLTSFQAFESRVESVTGSMNQLNNRLSAIEKEMLRLAGMSSVIKYFGGYEAELNRLKRKYGILHNFYSDCYGCVSNIRRVDRENGKISDMEIKNIGLLSSSGIVNIQNRQGLITNVLENGVISDAEYPLVKAISVSALSTIAQMKADKDYAAAKAGDTDAAFRFVRSVYSSPDHLKRIKKLGKDYPDAIIVGVLAQETAGKNKIPLAFIRRISELTGIEYDRSIFQINKVGRTGSGAAYRLANRPKFSGAVQAGRRYILADDVITAGGTLSELRNYIESHGGEVVHIVTGAAADKSTKFALSDKTRVELENKYGIMALKNFVRECDIYGGKVEYLTEAEGNYLLQFKSLDRARDRILAERNVGFIRQIGSVDGRSVSERGS